jgi:hypothetical protein
MAQNLSPFITQFHDNLMMKMANCFVAQRLQPRRTHCTVSVVARSAPRTSTIFLINLSHGKIKDK